MSKRIEKLTWKIMDTKTDRFRYIKPVTSLDTFQGMTRDFHEDGLFSTSIFGKVGTTERMLRSSYINLKINILAPKIYILLCGYRQLYKNIIAGTAYAVWDSKIKDFVKSNNIDGNTGFNFFLQHWKEIRFVKNASHSQNEAVDDLNKYREIAITSKAIVIPAGLRDVEISDDGEITKHEINDYYAKLLGVTNSLPDSGSLDNELTDRARLSLQLTYCELYEYLSKLTGRMKKSFMRKKWGSRRIKYGSRNVITTLPDLPSKVNDPRILKYNETAIGLYQACAVYAPVMVNKILNGYAVNYTNPTNGVINLINPKTLVREEVSVKPKLIDRWTTPTGLFKVIDSLEDENLRNQPIYVNGYYLGLVYKTDKHFRLINDINDLAGAGLDVKNVSPITYGEFFYIHGFQWFKDYPGTVTRYPINGYRSLYPTIPHVVTTGSDLYLTMLDENFEPTTIEAVHYPDVNETSWFDSMAPHTSRLPGLGADYDGDMCNFNPIFSLESRKAILAYLNSPQAYLNSSGTLLNDPFDEILERVLWALTGDPK